MKRTHQRVGYWTLYYLRGLTKNRLAVPAESGQQDEFHVRFHGVVGGKVVNLCIQLVPEKMVKGGYWDNIPVIVPCYGFYVVVQCFFLTFDVLCDGGVGTILPRTLTVDVWIEWG
jgi:hypothetical protein